eukprot:SAG31_NODE_1525_length_8006_cov_5.106614_2_plen_133_part_00
MAATPSNDVASDATAMVVKAKKLEGSRSNRGENLKCKCGEFQAGHIVMKFLQVGDCICDTDPENCKASWVRDGYYCPSAKGLGGDGADGERLAKQSREAQKRHRAKREQLRKRKVREAKALEKRQKQELARE